MTAVDVRSVSKRFGSVLAVDDVTINVARGEVVGLLGANGAGKTTLLRMVLGLLQPSTGAISLLGSRPGRRQRRRIGYVPQNLGLYADLTVAENLGFRAETYGVVAGAVGGGDLVGSISLGEQRRAAFVAATQHHPDLLVLDEPTSGVSPLARSRLWDLIHRHAEAGAAVLVSTHYTSEAEQTDRVVIMSTGRVVASGVPADIVAGREIVEVVADRWNEVFGLLDARHGRTSLAGRAVRVSGVSLEVVTRDVRAAGIPAEVRSVPATLEESLIALDDGGRS